jgi:hypothetical protein
MKVFLQVVVGLGLGFMLTAGLVQHMPESLALGITGLAWAGWCIGVEELMK